MEARQNYLFVTRRDDREKALKNQTYPLPKKVGVFDLGDDYTLCPGAPFSG